MESKRRQTETFQVHLGWLAGGSVLLGGLFQIILPVGNFWLGFLAASLLIFLSAGVLYFTWRAAGGGKLLAVMMLGAFVLRLALGIFLAWGLPRFGYDEREQEAGFVYADAYRREEQAWALANSDGGLLQGFGSEWEADQYGGLLVFSALVYRVFSPDAFRPALISIVTAAVFSLSLPFTVSELRRLLGSPASKWGGWILALYPEGVLLGAAQMREPFLIFFFSIGFWAAACWLERRCLKLALPLFVFSVVGLLAFSYRVAIPLLGCLLVWVWLSESAAPDRRWLRILGWIMLGLGAAAALLIFGDWITEVIYWDALQTYRQSGRVQYELKSLPDWMHYPFIVVYGLFQPVLPAAIAAPAPWLWRILGVFRGFGWYALLPLLLYPLFSVWRAPAEKQKRWLVLALIVVWMWVLIASARAGGDQWDNPRYRTILLPWMAGLAGWGLAFARAHRDRWLPRWLVVEGIFLLFFTEWYISRYYPVIPRLNFLVMIGLILALSLAVLLGGWLWDRKHPQKP
jgi:hypothetical protein